MMLGHWILQIIAQLLLNYNQQWISLEQVPLWPQLMIIFLSLPLQLICSEANNNKTNLSNNNKSNNKKNQSKFNQSIMIIGLYPILEDFILTISRWQTVNKQHWCNNRWWCSKWWWINMPLSSNKWWAWTQVCKQTCKEEWTWEWEAECRTMVAKDMVTNNSWLSNKCLTNSNNSNNSTSNLNSSTKMHQPHIKLQCKLQVAITAPHSICLLDWSS